MSSSTQHVRYRYPRHHHRHGLDGLAGWQTATLIGGSRAATLAWLATLGVEVHEEDARRGVVQMAMFAPRPAVR